MAVSLIAATQRPTQKAMGHGAVRSQMDVRICFRVRERKDVDLILGQGMLAAGWQAHTLNAPGKFLVSAAEHDTPRRARAYLITDEVVASTASLHADLRPPLDEVSQQAIEEQNRTEVPHRHRMLRQANRTRSPLDDEDEHGNADDDPEAILWAALSLAPDDGATVPELMTATGMSRPWIYLRLRELAERGQVVQVSRGRWRAASSDNPVIVYVYEPRARLHVIGEANGRIDKDVDNYAPLRNERRCPGRATTRGGDRSLQAYTVEQVAKMLNIGRDKVYYLLRTHQLRSIKIGKSRRITEEQLAEFIASREDAA